MADNMRLIIVSGLSGSGKSVARGVTSLLAPVVSVTQYPLLIPPVTLAVHGSGCWVTPLHVVLALPACWDCARDTVLPVKAAVRALTPIMRARGRDGAFSLGSSIHVPDKAERSAIHWACQHYKVDGLQLLLSHKSITTYERNPPAPRPAMSPQLPRDLRQSRKLAVMQTAAGAG